MGKVETDAHGPGKSLLEDALSACELEAKGTFVVRGGAVVVRSSEDSGSSGRRRRVTGPDSTTAPRSCPAGVRRVAASCCS